MTNNDYTQDQKINALEFLIQAGRNSDEQGNFHFHLIYGAEEPSSIDNGLAVLVSMKMFEKYPIKNRQPLYYQGDPSSSYSFTVKGKLTKRSLQIYKTIETLFNNLTSNKTSHSKRLFILDEFFH